jgi:hypothetical protein
MARQGALGGAFATMLEASTASPAKLGEAIVQVYEACRDRRV